MHQSNIKALPNDYNQDVSYCFHSDSATQSIVKDSILHHILTNDLVSPFQYGFLPGRSCSTQLLSIMDYFTKSLDMQHGVDVIYLDFQKTFDTAP